MDLIREMNSFYKWWILNLSLQWLLLGLCSASKIKTERPHLNMCYEALTSFTGTTKELINSISL